MKRIHLLDDPLINKIAAGEVVERPSGVLKEICENALDAGATSLLIDLEDGGIKKISVQDNGHGIHPHDITLALTRHATSKIQNLDDLYRITSLGFRGEALASIASVSQFTLFSRHKDHPEGQKLVCSDELDKISISPTQGPVGTRVTVEQLFYNVPARLQFLRNIQTEWSYCLEWVQALAMAHPQVTITLTHNGKEKLAVTGLSSHEPSLDELKKRTFQIFQDEDLKELIAFEGKGHYGFVKGLLSPPGVEKLTTKHQLTFVNGRWVKDKILKLGIQRGYHSHVLKGRFPQIFLYFTTDPSLVDVNVHPSKTELRFQYPGEVQNHIAMAIRDALRSNTWVKSQEIENKNENENESEKKVEKQIKPIAQPEKSNQREQVDLKSGTIKKEIKEPYIKPQIAERSQEVVIHERKPTVAAVATVASVAKAELRGKLKTEPKTFFLDGAAYLGNFQKGFLFFEKNKELILLDQHAFHERIIFERLEKNPDYLQRSQKLLIPQSITLSPRELAVFQSLEPELKSFGLKFKILGDLCLEIRSIPILFVDRPIESLIQGILELGTNGLGKDGGKILQHQILATMACHGAVRIGDDLCDSQREALLLEAKTVDFCHNCPHGRRVFRVFSKREVQGWFDRS